jgi:TonB-dependent SusC/RagA subfamily outer membrane receptor
VSGSITDAASGRALPQVRVQIVGNQQAVTATDPNGVSRNVLWTGHPSSAADRLSTRNAAAHDPGQRHDNGRPAALGERGRTGAGRRHRHRRRGRKRQVGASIAEVDVTKLAEQVAIPDVGRMLSAKVTGLRSTTVGGGVGTGQDLRIRGTASFTLSQRPAIYVDGVRVDSRATEWFNTGACCSFGGGASTDRLGDLNPNDIERVEVLKGAAAATLYGSEATNGVIQIFTKRGHTGEQRTQWNMGLSTGFEELRHNLPTRISRASKEPTVRWRWTPTRR